MVEGGNINRPQFFDGTNYVYWKVRMRVFLISIDEWVWQSIEFGWINTTEIIVDVPTVKPRSKL